MCACAHHTLEIWVWFLCSRWASCYRKEETSLSYICWSHGKIVSVCASCGRQMQGEKTTSLPTLVITRCCYVGIVVARSPLTDRCRTFTLVYSSLQHWSSSTHRVGAVPWRTEETTKCFSVNICLAPFPQCWLLLTCYKIFGASDSALMLTLCALQMLVLLLLLL